MTVWRTARIESFCTVGAGGTPSRDSIERYYEGGTIPWVKSGELRETIISETEEHITEAALRETNAKMVPAGALLLAMYGATVGRLGSLGVPATTNQAVCHIIPDPKEAEVRYLFHALSNQVANIVARGVGGAQPNISQRIVRDLAVPLPPLPEQRRIADILDKADALRAKRRAALAQLDTLTQSVFLDMFGDPATNPKGWPRMELQEVFDIARGGSPRPIDDFITEADDGINWIMIGDATEGGKYITKTKKRIRPEGASRSRAVKPGDFLLTNSMSFGRPYIMGMSGCIHDGWLVLSPRAALEPDYFYTLLGSRAVFAEFQRRAPGATVKNLNIDLVRSVSVPVAPTREQRAFAQAVSAIERATGPFNRSLEEFEHLFASLQHRAFRGEL